MVSLPIYDILTTMDYVYGVLLGIVQGVTEFFPISSSGHLILLPQLLGQSDQGLAIDAVLHLATALAIIFYFRKDFISMVMKWRTSKTLRKLIIAAIPAVIAGLVLDSIVETVFRSGWVVVATLSGVALLMWWVEKNYTEVRVMGDDHSQELDLSRVDQLDALIIGLSQVFALIPGTSRSGITIITGMWRKVPRATAAKFSFLLGAPITLGAGLLKSIDLVKNPATDWGFVFVAGLTTFGVALWSMSWLLSYLKTHTLKPFIIYRIVLAVAVSVFLLMNS